MLYTGFWSAYAEVLPKGQRQATGKGAGQTYHIERFNGILRQRLAQFVRRTLSFSKCEKMHESCLLLSLPAFVLAPAQQTHPNHLKQLNEYHYQCFIAAACCGTEFHPHVNELRLFRENILKPILVGRKFIQGYECLSPPFASIISRSKALRVIIGYAVVRPALSLARLFDKRKV